MPTGNASFNATKTDYPCFMPASTKMDNRGRGEWSWHKAARHRANKEGR